MIFYKGKPQHKYQDADKNAVERAKVSYDSLVFSDEHQTWILKVSINQWDVKTTGLERV